MLSGPWFYQIWNVSGHAIPTLFLLFYDRKKWEYAIAGLLISTVVMDSPVWGFEVLYFHPGATEQLWTTGNLPTRDVWEWIGFYYNPLGTYGVWEDGWFPPAWLMFWSVIGRIAVAIGLILYQHRREKDRETRLTFRIVHKRLRLIDPDEKIH